MKRWVLLLLLIVTLGGQATLASNIRIQNLGGFVWLIDDDTNNLINPANAAFSDKRYASSYFVNGDLRYPSGNTGNEQSAAVQFIVPVGSILGMENVLGGILDSYALTQYLAGKSGSYQYYGDTKTFYIQDSLKLTEKLAVGASVAYTSAPMLGHYTYPIGYVVEYRDYGSDKVVEWTTAYRPIDGSAIELKLVTVSQSSDVRRFINHNYDQGFTYDYKYNDTMIAGKVSHTVLDRLKLAAIVKVRNWNENDDGQLDKGKQQNIMLGASYKVGKRLGLFAGTERKQNDSALAGSTLSTVLGGGAEYSLNDSVTLRGGFSQSDKDQSVGTTLSVGAGLNIKWGQIDLCIDSNNDSANTKSEVIAIGFSSSF